MESSDVVVYDCIDCDEEYDEYTKLVEHCTDNSHKLITRYFYDGKFNADRNIS